MIGKLSAQFLVLGFNFQPIDYNILAGYNNY